MLIHRVTAAVALRAVIEALQRAGSLGELLAALVAEARAFTDADEAYVLLRQGERLVLRAGVGLPRRALGLAFDARAGLEGAALASHATVAVPDARAHPRFVDPFDRRAPPRAMIVAPMAVGGRTEGVLVVGRRTPGLFGEPTVWWLELLASLGAIAVAQDEAVRFQERRARQAELMLSLADVPSEGPEPFLRRLSRAVGQAIGADQVDVLMLDPDLNQLVGEAGSVPADATHPLARVFRGGQPWLVGDVAVDETAQRLYGRLGLRSAAAVPLRVGEDVRGVLHVAATQPGALGDDELAFLQLLAERVGLLLEREEVRQRRSDARAREEFVGVVSHELKTPVAVVQAYVELLERRAEREGRESDRDVLGKIGEQTSHMLAMIEELLDVQRIDAGVLHLELSRFDLGVLATRVAEGLQLTSEAHRIRVEAAEPVVVLADRRRIEEILTNLVENAIKYAPGEGEVAVRVTTEQRRRQPAARVEVSDQGVGISREDQTRVFDRFYRAGARGDRLHRGHHGLGLGLYIARQLVLRHRGEMGVESTPGRGSTFWFWLPVNGPEPEQ